MPSTTSLDRIVFEGPFGLAGAIVLGLVLVALCGWSLWRERGILGWPSFSLFWLTRAVAVVVVVWMLLAPNRVRIETSTTKRSIVVVSDVSGSMQTVDPPGTADDLRWAVATSNDSAFHMTLATDKAVVALGQARHHLQQATAQVRQHATEADILKSLQLAHLALEHVEASLDEAQESSGNSSELVRLRSKVQGMLAGAEFEEFDRLCNALERERTPTQKGWQEGLSDLEYRVSGIEAVIQELARQTQVEESQQVAAREPQLLAGMKATSRSSRQALLLDQLSSRTLKELGDKADVRLRTFADAVYLTSEQAPVAQESEEGTAVATTNLSGVLEQIPRDQQDQPVAAVFVLTDVAHNAANTESPRSVAAKISQTPVYVVPIGNPGYVRDIQLQSVSAPAVAMRNDDIVVEARIEAHECNGEACTVQLLQEGEVIDFRDITFDNTFSTRTVRFERLMPTVGPQQFQVAISPLDGESTTENNYREFEVQVTRSDIKLLLADEMPRWEFRYLAQLFRRDDKVECDELLFHPRLIATGRRQETGTFPVTVDDWDQYDVVILGDLIPDHLPVAAQESLTEYLSRRGGTVVVIAGTEAMPQAFQDHPLVDILPVTPLAGGDTVAPSGYSFRVTPEGEHHHALMIAETDEATRTAWEFVNKFAPLHELSAWRQPRPTAHTLISGVPRGGLETIEEIQQSAFLCWQPVGRGRVVYLSGPETFRLRFLRGDRLHYRFWGQLLRWAIASDLAVGTEYVRIKTDKSRYETGNPVEFRVQLTSDDGEPVTTSELLQVQLTTGESEQFIELHPQDGVPGEYVAELHALAPGVYRAEPVGAAVDTLQAKATTELDAATSFTVKAEVPQELIDTRCNRPLAQQIAAVTGGLVLPPTAIDEVLALTNLEPIVSERIERRPLWLQWKFLWIVFICLQVEWLIRKWYGLS